MIFWGEGETLATLTATKEFSLILAIIKFYLAIEWF